MPTQTFFNLPQQKQDSITNAALDEFLEQGYARSRVSAIIERAGIATGSFYQYFENLDDILLYLFKTVAQKKITYVKSAMENQSQETFAESLKAIYRAGIQFAVENKKMAELGNRIFEIQKTPIFAQMIKQSGQEDTSTLLNPIIQRGIKNGEIRKDIDSTLITLLITNINVAVMNYLSEKNTQTKKKRKKAFDIMDFNQVAELAVNTLLFGIAKQ